MHQFFTLPEAPATRRHTASRHQINSRRLFPPPTSLQMPRAIINVERNKTT